jgi:DNA replication protein DnaD
LLKVNHEDKKVLVGNNLIELKRGQAVASLTYLAELWNTSKRTAERFVELLEQDNMLSRCTRQKVTVLTICNYDSHQDYNSNGCANVCANDEPIGIQSVAENKNVKNVEEINITTTAHTHTCTCEEFAQRYRAENNWQEIAMMLHTSIESCQSLFSEFVSFQKHDGKTWNDYNDFKRHFRIWAGKRVLDKPKEPKKPKVKTGADVLREMGL